MDPDRTPIDNPADEHADRQVNTCGHDGTDAHALTRHHQAPEREAVGAGVTR